MAAQQAFDFTIPDAGVAAGFTAGERALAVADPLTATPGGTTFYLSRSMYFAGGQYSIKINSSDPVSVWLGKSLITSNRIAQINTPSNTPLVADFFIREGVHRLDLWLTNLGAAASACYAAFSIWQGGKLVYAPQGADWLFDTSVLPDASLSFLGDPRLSLPVFSMLPNWNGGITERLAWNTEILTSETSVEQRRSLRRNPTRSFEAGFLRTSTDRMRFDSFVRGIGTRNFLCPFWPEQMKLTEAIPVNTQSMAFPAYTFEDREFFPGELAMISNKVSSEFELLEIDSIESTGTADTITFKSGTTRAWPGGARMTPVHVVHFDTIPEVANVTDRAATVQARFNFKDSWKFITPSWGYCAPLWQFKLDRATPLQMHSERQVFTTDAGFGTPDVFDFGGVNRVGVKADLKLFGRKRLRAYRAFASMARGRQVRFWWPSGTHDIEPSGPMGGTTLDVVRTGLADWMTQPQDTNVMVGIYFKGTNPPIYREIIRTERQGSNSDTITFDRALPALDRSDILRISFIMPVRFDQDGFELFHVTDEAKVVQAAVVVRSAEIDGMPPIDCGITSLPYPLDASDSISGSIVFVSGGYKAQPFDTLELTGSASFVAASIQTILKSAKGDPLEEGVTGVPSYVAGSIVTLLKSYTETDLSAVIATPAFVSASSRNLVITHNLDIEAIETSTTFIGATLV